MAIGREQVNTILERGISRLRALCSFQFLAATENGENEKINGAQSMNSNNTSNEFKSEQFETLIDHISQAETLTEIWLHLNYEFYGDKSLFY